MPNATYDVSLDSCHSRYVHQPMFGAHESIAALDGSASFVVEDPASSRCNQGQCRGQRAMDSAHTASQGHYPGQLLGLPPSSVRNNLSQDWDVPSMRAELGPDGRPRRAGVQ